MKIIFATLGWIRTHAHQYIIVLNRMSDALAISAMSTEFGIKKFSKFINPIDYKTWP